MRVRELHPWDLTPQEAIRVQVELAGLVVETGDLSSARFVAGVDVSVGPPARAAVVVLDIAHFRAVEIAVEQGELTFPYVPGLLSFRESPLILRALRRIEGEPDALLVDGQGRAHPRRFGIACHIGVLANRPSVGCGKSLLVGKYGPVGERRGSWAPIFDGGQRVGAALRTKEGAKPIFVSVGHMCSMEAAVDLVLRCTGQYRIPEPIRWAHRLASGDSGRAMF